MEIRTITNDEIEAYRSAVMTTFGDDSDVDPNGAERFRALIENSQAWIAVDGPTIVATSASFNLELVVPGGELLPMAGLTMVTVRPTHRRRGILRELVRLHLDDARKRGHPISGLWASEAPIYGRFGYGIAAESNAMTIDRTHTLRLTTHRELDELEWIDEARAREVLPPIFKRATADRPGAFVRSDAWWQQRRFLEASFARGGASKRRHVLARRGNELVGYVQFRQRGTFRDDVPAGRAEIIELIGVDSRANATLWKFMFELDLFPTVAWSNAPIDEPLPWIVDDARRIQRRRVDTLWLRIDDIPRTLAARRYEADGVLRFRVDDTTYELVVEAGRARCTSSDRAPDLTLSRPALGSLYLGGVRATVLARADCIRGNTQSLALADRMFASTIAPWCPEQF